MNSYFACTRADRRLARRIARQRLPVPTGQSAIVGAARAWITLTAVGVSALSLALIVVGALLASARELATVPLFLIALILGPILVVRLVLWRRRLDAQENGIVRPVRADP